MGVFPPPTCPECGTSEPRAIATVKGLCSDEHACRARRLAKDPEYQLNANGHSDDCVWRFGEEHDDCLNGDQCRVGESVLHECGSTEHYMP